MTVPPMVMRGSQTWVPEVSTVLPAPGVTLTPASAVTVWAVRRQVVTDSRRVESHRVSLVAAPSQSIG
jgi:hypothetical protein